ncbi:MAG: hypothetical protein KAS90_01290, partial [Candidatus Aenigmarchaeota archaeon]|nr:hypothetical protein [Candidatus Aenigmarchaeota archaeon]
ISADKGTLSENTLTIEAGNSDIVLLLVDIEKDDTEDLTVSVTAESERAEASEEITVSMKDFDSCYGISVSSDSDTIFAEDLNGYLYTLTVKNEGEFNTEYTASIEGPKWVSINPETVSVKAGESTEIFVYASPEYTTSEGTYTINVVIESDMGNIEEKELKFSFRSEKIVTPPITGDVTTGTDDEQPIDDKIDEEEDKKFPTNILTAIIIGIIIILLIIFGPELLKEGEEKEEEKEVKEEAKEEKKAEKPKAAEKKEEPKKEAEKPKPVIAKKAEVKKKAEKPKAAPVKAKAAPVKAKPAPKKAAPAPKKKAVPAKKKEKVREDRKDDIKQILDNI